MKRALFVAFAGAVLFSSPVYAVSVSGTLSAQYFEVLNNGSGAPDFGGTGSPVIALGSGLGPNGLPIATGGVSSIDPTTHQLTWWSPSLNSAVLATGTGTVSIPYGSNMYAPNSTGGNDSRAFETAIFSGNFNLSSPGSVNFGVNSDDDTFVYLNGILIGQNPGIHGVTSVSFAGNGLSGNNTLEIFYADREQTGAYLSVTADVALSPAVPEPSTWAMMILGFCGMGLVAYRRRYHFNLAA